MDAKRDARPCPAYRTDLLQHQTRQRAEFFSDELGGVGVDHIGDLDHLALLHQEADNVNGTLSHTVGKFLNGNRFRNNDFARNLFLGFNLLMAFEPLHAAFEGCERADALFVLTRCTRYRQTATPLVINPGCWLGWNRHANRRTTTCATDRRLALFFIGFEHCSARTARRNYNAVLRWWRQFLAFTISGAAARFAFGFLFDFIVEPTTIILFRLTGCCRFALDLFGGFTLAACLCLDFSLLALNFFTLACFNKRHRTGITLVFGEGPQHNT